MDEPYFIKYPVGQHPITLAKYAPKNVISATEFVMQNLWACKTIPNSQSPNINSELLLLSGLNCTTWVYITPKSLL
jgi:hypothetical protein